MDYRRLKPCSLKLGIKDSNTTKNDVGKKTGVHMGKASQQQPSSFMGPGEWKNYSELSHWKCGAHCSRILGWQ